ncbi:MAG: DUF3883 domain-containing protein [Aequorivita antarctica]
MKITELREYQTEFQKIKKDLNTGFKEIDRLRNKFVQDYSANEIKQMALDDFVVGKGSAITFCNRMENELNEWGNIHGSNARKFGLYFGTFGDDKERKYRIGKKAFGTDHNQALQKILFSIIELIENKDNTKLIKKNPISPMFKGKILSVYYPNKFLNIFSASHLNYFINALGLDNNSTSEIDKQSLLLNFKNNDAVMKDWSIYIFSKFLYSSFKNPNDEIKDDELPNELKDYKLKDFPPIETLKIDFVELQTEQIDPQNSGEEKSKNKKPDYSAQSKNFKRIGDRGEQIVLRAERQFLTKNGREDLAKKISHISEKDDRAGFDIMSYDLNGQEKPIEVKATLRKIGNSKFFLSANELLVSLKNNNYHFYLVYETGGKQPKIWKVKTSDLIDDKNIIKTPVLYQLNLYTK